MRFTLLHSYFRSKLLFNSFSFYFFSFFRTDSWELVAQNNYNLSQLVLRAASLIKRFKKNHRLHSSKYCGWGPVQYKKERKKERNWYLLYWGLYFIRIQKKIEGQDSESISRLFNRRGHVRVADILDMRYH